VLDVESVQGRSMILRDPVTGRYSTFYGGGFQGRCRGQNITIESDSLESYGQNELHILIGNVKYREDAVAIDAARATYYRTEERLLLEEAVHAVLPRSGATLDGPRVEYFRAVRGIRQQPRFVATQRPTLTYVEKDSLGNPSPPVMMNANTITGEGDSTFFGSGQVRIVRQELVATGDSAVFDGARRFARLLRDPVIRSEGAQAYTLRGRVIDLFGATRQLDRVVAIDSASATSRDFTLRSDTLDLRVRDNRLSRAFAFGPQGARATTQAQDVVADSLDIIMPDQRIQELRAVGKAFAESEPDTSRIRTDERDWLRGDTVIARFDSVRVRGDTAQPKMRELFANGNASAYYQIAADTANRTRPGISYSRGRAIRLQFANGEVETVSVLDSASGVFLEPAGDSAGASGVRPGQRPPARPAVPPVRPPGSLRRPPDD
jgi:lipopolysaccharide export system protein LptA